MDHTVGFDEDPPPEPRDGWLLVRIQVPELNVSKCLQFPSERLVWDVKQQVLASLPKELKESFNYGLFCPPSNGKAGKFLDEERRLGDYPFNGPVGYLELKYKRRVYKMLNLDEKQLKALHTRANLRRFLECINGGHVDKIAKMCAKGLDPNFHCPETGDTPLTMATGAKRPNKLLIALVNGGALLDYRTRDGGTALHRAVERDCLEAVTTLLELGASPNYKDSRGLTPLYLSVTKKTDSKICESLLHDHGTLGIQDSQGWQEVHQACRYGLVQHLEHLLFYGADMDGHNASGNTPLHVCAVNNQDACARMLLFRGAQRVAINYANQTPYQVAVIAGNLELAEMIQNYKSEDIVPFRGPPRYNPRRRSGIGWGSTLSRIGVGPPSPCPSEHHPFSSASSSLSEGSSSHRSHGDDISIVTDKSIGDTSDIISDSSGVGTNSDSAACSIGHPSATVVCMQPYTGTSLGHLSIKPGDVIEVVGSTDCGLLEGYVRGVNRSGFFPEHCVQEVNIRQKNIHNVSTASGLAGGPQNEYRSLAQMQQEHQLKQQQQLMSHQQQIAQQYSSLTAPRIKKGGETGPRNVILHRAKRGFGFILRGAKAASPLMQLQPSERCPGLQYLDDVDPGGVADMAGLRPGDFLLDINGEDVRCASHEHVVDLIRTSGSLVSMTVISQNFPNNFQQQVASQQQQQNHQNQPNNTTTQLLHHLQQQQQQQLEQQQQNGNAARQCATLPRKMPIGMMGARSPAPMPPRRDPKTTLSVGRARAKSMVAGLENGGEKDDDDLASTNKSSSAESIHQQSLSAASTPTQTGPGTPTQLRTASIKARPTSSRITAAELEELFQRQQGETTSGGNRYSTMMTSSRFQSGTDSGAATPPPASPLKTGPIVYASVAEMKRKKATGKNGTLRGKPCPIPVVSADLKRTFHSTPELATALNSSTSSIWTPYGAKSHRSQDDMHALLNSSMQRLVLPAPTHPPPPPPVGQVVKVDVSRGSEYDSTVRLQKQLQDKDSNGKIKNGSVSSADTDDSADIRSSFKPAANAKLYASPQDIRMMAFRARVAEQQNSAANNARNTLRKSISIRSETEPIAETPQDQPPTPAPAVVDVQSAHNPYAQPIWPAGQQQVMNGNRNNTMPAKLLHAPPIPDPDYSLSESDGETENSILLAHNTKMNEHISMPPAENSGNSHMSGSSSGSGSMSHSFSVDEIQKMRVKLKTSTSFPNELRQPQQAQHQQSIPPSHHQDQLHLPVHHPHLHHHEEGDNSSSGVSSDQEMTFNHTTQSHSTPQKPTQQQHQPPTAQQQYHSSNHIIHSHPKPAVLELNKYAPSPNNNNNNNTNHSTPKPSQGTPVGFGTLRKKGHHHHIRTIDMDREAAMASDHEDDRDDVDHDSPSPPSKGFQRHNSLTRKQAASIAMSRAMQSRSSAVSLVKLPPPIEGDIDEPDISPIPPSMRHSPHPMHRPGSTAPISRDPPAEMIVLAPPPQFCDCIHASSTSLQPAPPKQMPSVIANGGGTIRGVRIVGALPK